jgi:hypothetical protein
VLVSTLDDLLNVAVLIVLYGITTTANNVFTSITTSENQFIVEAFCTYLHLAMRAMAC